MNVILKNQTPPATPFSETNALVNPHLPPHPPRLKNPNIYLSKNKNSHTHTNTHTSPLPPPQLASDLRSKNRRTVGQVGAARWWAPVAGQCRVDVARVKTNGRVRSSRGLSVDEEAAQEGGPRERGARPPNGDTMKW